LSEVGYALGGHDHAGLEEYLEAVNLEVVVQAGGTMVVETLLIGQLIIVGMKRIEYNMVCREMRDSLGVGDSQFWNDAVLGVCCTQSMLYSVLTLDDGMERSRAMTLLRVVR